MLRHRFIGLIASFALTLTVLGCDRQKPEPSGGTVKASAAYLQNFGQPPTAKRGLCYARVGYFPLRSDPTRVRAVPFFLFRETGQLQPLLDRLVDGEVPLSPDSGLFNPFPTATQVRVQSRDGNAVTLDLAFAEKSPTSAELSAIAAVLTETAAQFEGIERVVLRRGGEPLTGAPAEGYRSDPARVVPVAPPALFMVAGSWERGGAGPEEIVANFDRPVRVKFFRLEDADGREIKGEYFQSVFNMAVVIHPAQPASIHPGMVLRAAWDITDYLGRRGQGTAPFPLQRHEHPAPAASRTMPIE